jgi:hypothetical protein
LRKRPWRRYAATTAIIVGGLYTGYHYSYGTETPPPAGDAVTANIWIDTSGGSCADNASLIAYPNSGVECSGLAAAVAAADPGDVIGWKGGTYSSAQVVARNASLDDLSPGCDPYGEWGSVSTANCVQVKPETGETVVVDNYIEVKASSLWIRGTATGSITSPAARSFNIQVDAYVSMEATSNTQSPDHNIFEGIDANQLGTYNTQYAMMLDSDAGPATTGGGLTPEPTEIVWEGVYFHGFQRNTDGRDYDCHQGGFFIKSGNNITFRKNAWSGNAVYNIQIQRVGDGPQVSALLIENNWFGCPVDWIYLGAPCIGQADVQFNNSGTMDDVLIRYNSMVNGISSFASATLTNWRIVGNAGSKPSTTPCTGENVTFGYNVWDSGTCGATDTDGEAVSGMFVNATPGSEDLHLLNGSVVANNKVTPTTSDYTVTTDIDDASRTAGSRDAGSDER